MRVFALAALFAGAFALPAFAHGPTPHKADETVTIAKPPTEVWKVIADFGSLAKWNPQVKESTVSKGNEPGSERKVVLASGGELIDNLDTYDAATMTYSYRLYQENVEVFPVSYYTAEISVKAVDGSSEVLWSARYYRGDTHNDPPENLNDEAAAKAITTFYRSGLDELKRQLEK
jgi:mxaD protein